MMHRYALPVVLTFLAACGGTEEELAQPGPRPVKIHIVSAGSEANIRLFPGTVRASQQADLSFRVSGVLQEIPVREGDTVEEGALLARLDPTDYRLTVEQRQATFENARTAFARAEELIKTGNISRGDYDRLQAEFRSAQAALNLARRNLEYTELRAPFDGSVAGRLVDNFEEVRASQTIIRFQDDTMLDIVYNVPENLVRRLDPTTAEERFDRRRSEQLGIVATFEGTEQTYPLTLNEASRAADEGTQTFRVTMSMPAPTDIQVLPGMTATVIVNLNRLFSDGAATWIPTSALVGDNELEPTVWLLDPDTMKVTQQTVTVGRLEGRRVEVLSGLNEGDQVVATGAAYLDEGMEVARMSVSEQAVPREA